MNQRIGRRVVATIVVVVARQCGGGQSQTQCGRDLRLQRGVCSVVLIAVTVRVGGIDLTRIKTAGFHLRDRDGACHSVANQRAMERGMMVVIAARFEKPFQRGLSHAISGGHQNDAPGVGAPQ